MPMRRVPNIWRATKIYGLGEQYRGNNVSVPLNNSEWGRMGQQIKQLGERAAALDGQHPMEEKRLTEALTIRFPWLKGSDLYIPWNSEQNTTDQRTAMVICAGKKNYHLASHLIVSLRRVHKSTMPIEIAYAGDDDLTLSNRRYLQSLASNITFINLLKVFPNAKDELVNSGWGMKPFALLASKFPHTMLVDADALFLSSPEDLFQSHPELQRTGTLFYHDRAASGGGDEGLVFLKEQIKAAGLEPSSFLTNNSLYYSGDSWYEADSGLVCLDRTRPQVFLGLVFAAWLNTKDVRDEVSYKLFYGDKETFWIAMELSNVEYYFESLYAGSMGTSSKKLPASKEQKTEESETKEPKTKEPEAAELCSTHMLHMDPTGAIPFWLNGGIYQHKDMPDKGYANLTHFWAGNLDNSTKAKWWWADGNVACFKEKGVKLIDPVMKEIINKMIGEAGKVDKEILRLSG